MRHGHVLCSRERWNQRRTSSATSYSNTSSPCSPGWCSSARVMVVAWPRPSTPTDTGDNEPRAVSASRACAGRRRRRTSAQNSCHHFFFFTGAEVSGAGGAGSGGAGGAPPPPPPDGLGGGRFGGFQPCRVASRLTSASSLAPLAG